MQINISLPDWAIKENEQLPEFIPDLEDRMAAVIRFSRLNVEHDTGGPFSAGVFERDTGKVIVIGVNRVVPEHCSSAHAEIVTLSLAQKILGTHDLGGPGMPAYQLVVNWLPCAMCYGSLAWSGIRSLALAGSGPELEAITGFDEGPIHPNWVEELHKRDIDVLDGIMIDAACDVFRLFAKSGKLVYNGRLGATE